MLILSASLTVHKEWVLSGITVPIIHKLWTRKGQDHLFLILKLWMARVEFDTAPDTSKLKKIPNMATNIHEAALVCQA